VLVEATFAVASSVDEGGDGIACYFHNVVRDGKVLKSKK
jgi:hypothetical protein